MANHEVTLEGGPAARTSLASIFGRVTIRVCAVGVLAGLLLTGSPLSAQRPIHNAQVLATLDSASAVVRVQWGLVEPDERALERANSTFGEGLAEAGLTILGNDEGPPEREIECDILLYANNTGGLYFYVLTRLWDVSTAQATLLYQTGLAGTGMLSRLNVEGLATRCVNVFVPDWRAQRDGSGPSVVGNGS